MQTSTEILLAPGDILYREGDPNECAYVIETGEIVLYSEATGRRVDCERRGAGSIVGELSILTGQPRAVTVEAVTPCRIFRIPADQILNRFERLDPVLRACIETSISFTGTFTRQLRGDGAEAPFAPSTLRNSDDLLDELRVEADILKGLEQGQFSMVYQPIVDMRDTSIVGAEALMRWEHPALGAVSPLRFIRVAEAMGSIGKLTEFALTEACTLLQQIERIPADTPGPYVSVNISGTEIAQGSLVDLVTMLVEVKGIRPGALRLEVTETALCHDRERAARNLARLRDLGCGLSIDDFGTGFSNLAYLKLLPLTALKIDRSFAADVADNLTSRSIVSMLLGLGRDLDVDIIAEGLETQRDVDAIRALDCVLAQGFFFHRPMPADRLLATLGAQPGRRAIRRIA